MGIYEQVLGGLDGACYGTDLYCEQLRAAFTVRDASSAMGIQHDYCNQELDTSQRKQVIKAVDLNAC